MTSCLRQLLLVALCVAACLSWSSCAGTDLEGDDPGECSDGADNDEDSLFDCDDPDCSSQAACAPLQDDDDSADGDDDDDSAGDDDDDSVGDDDDSASICQPCAGDLTISTDVDVAAAAHCSSIEGSLVISDAPAQFAGALSCLTEVVEDLRVEANTNLQSLLFLSSLASVGDDLSFEDNDALLSVSGMSSLQQVGGDLRIEDNNQLTELTALSNLVSVGDELYIWDNDLLTDLAGLESLDSVGGGLFISGNDGLLNLAELAGLRTLGSALNISSNRGLLSVDGLSGLTTMGGNLSITDNDALCQDAAQALADLLPVTGTVLVLGNDGVCP